ncbi:GAF domain-containing protein [Aureibacter tunicatorum]|uniref:GAF domain-containing protein n=1 Tax=Aureibacter tunicatorum TaxID=866807 RepID=A0AAE4BTX0_9BACT|nr:GAF domain-containing protein [Aureibacter tunicatorum]MDR6240223.1 GAF domain-containing protein [Aureibacter tunicatorum]BDD05896.1 diguanylate cyclase [Aureibacter tunicatorum]
MSETLLIDQSASKKEKYEALIPQIKALISTESDITANLANVSAALKEAMNFFWVGFYIVKNDELVLGPFQGPIACTRIKKGKGVCGTAWQNAETILVPNVDQFPGHIACSSASKSEIVVPVIKSGSVEMILDVDSDKLNDFDSNDQIYLEKLCAYISEKI